MLRTPFTALLLAGAGLAPAASAQGSKFRDALPAGTLGYISVPDLKTSFQEFQRTPLAKMWREEELQDFVADGMQMAKAQLKQLLAQGAAMHQQGMLPVDPADLLKAPPESMSIALTTFEVALGQFGNPQPRLGMIGHVDLGEAAGAWTKLIRFGLQQLIAQSGGMVEPKTSKVGDVEITSLQAPGTDMGLNIAFVGKNLFLATLKDELATFLTSMKEQKVGLSGTESFKRTFAHLDAQGAEVEAYVNLSGAMETFMSTLRLMEKEAPGFPAELSVDGIQRALVAFGFEGMKSIGFTSSYGGENGDKCYTKSFMYSPAPVRRGILAATSAGKVDKSLLRVVPKNASSVSLTTVNTMAIYNGLIDALKAYNPEMSKALLERLAGMEQQMGVSLKDDIFGAFGKQCLFYSMGVSNMMAAPEGALVLQVPNKDRLMANLNKAVGLAQGMISLEGAERRGIKTWSLEVNGPVDPQMTMILNILKPSFGFKDGYMVLALSSGDVRKTINRLGRDADAAGEDVRANKEFGQYLKSIEQTEVTGLSWTDWRNSFEQVYGLASGALGFVGTNDQIPFDLMLLPEAETLSKHLFSAFTVSTTNADGFLSTTTSPMGPEMMAGAVAAIMGGATFAGLRAAPMAAPVRRGGK